MLKVSIGETMLSNAASGLSRSKLAQPPLDKQVRSYRLGGQVGDRKRVGQRAAVGAGGA